MGVEAFWVDKEQDHDQQEPQKAEEREEAKVAVVVAVIHGSSDFRVGRDHLGGVTGDEGEDAHDRRDDQGRESPDPSKTERSIHIETSLLSCLDLGLDL